MSRPLINRWVGEYCSPVVATISTVEAERICLKNGMLLHELLSCFGHLDGMNCVIRAGNQILPMHDAHIRFERITEVQPKNTELLEKLARENFEEFDNARLPSTIGELKASPPTAWTPGMEQLVMRAVSFSEQEMISTPMVILAVISTTDVDHVACMEELSSIHHTPAVLQSGQYDPNVQRVFMLLNDANEPSEDALSILNRLQSKFPASCTRVLTINSLSEEATNLQQPDMWSRYFSPLYFSQDVPTREYYQPLPLNPINGAKVFGGRLSMEDFMALREFCLYLFTEQIIPSIEKKLFFLNKQVSDARKGVKNVLKSFWRKPREESESAKGGLKYRFDKIETQILLLADLSFIIRDYETAYSMYKLVRDDYKADKSILHLAHTSLMISACQLLTDSHRVKDLHISLDALSQTLPAMTGDNLFANATYALIASEMFVHHQHSKSPIESARVLLQAAANLAQRCPLLSGLLMERAASFFLTSGQVRRYVFHVVLAGNKLHKCGLKPSRHAGICFAISMLVLEKGHWGDLKVKLSRALSSDLKFLGREGAQRSFLLMLKILAAGLSESKDVGNKGSLLDSVSVFNEILLEGAWGSIHVEEGWKLCSTRQILLGSLPIKPMDILAGDITSFKTEVCELGIPELDKQGVTLIRSLNGQVEEDILSVEEELRDIAMSQEMYRFMELEIQFVKNRQRGQGKNRLLGGEKEGNEVFGVADSHDDEFVGKWTELEMEYLQAVSGTSTASSTLIALRKIAENIETLRVPLGEKLQLRMKMCNKLPLELKLTNLRFLVNQSDKFEQDGIEVQLNPDVGTEIVLAATPKEIGEYRVNSMNWQLSEHLCVKQGLIKEGPLLHKTLKQRESRQRAEDKSLDFQVVAPHPRLRLVFEGLSAEVLQGQLLKSTLVLKNEGAAPACDIYIKLSQPSFVFYLDQREQYLGRRRPSMRGKFIEFFGDSSTVLWLGSDCTIQPGQQLRLDAWLRITQPGLQRISLLAAYKALRGDGSRECFGPGDKCRTSFVSVQTMGLPSVGLAVRLAPRTSSALQATLITEIRNFIHQPQQSDVELRALEGRFSSMGQIDLPDFTEEFFEVDENCVKVVGVWVLGAIDRLPRPAKTPMEEKGQESTGDQQMVPNFLVEERLLLASPGEIIVECYPLTLLHERAKETSGDGQVRGTCQWLMPLPDSTPLNYHPAQIPAVEGEAQVEVEVQHTQSYLEQVLEQFLCVAAASELFEKRILEGRELLRIQISEADTIGPRTISQVRRDKELKEQKESLLAGKLTEISLLEDVPLEYTAEGGVYESTLKESTVDNTVGKNHSKNKTHEMKAVPVTVQDIADQEARDRGTQVVLVWVCRWEGKIRWGMDSLAHVGFSSLNKSSQHGGGAGSKKEAVFPETEDFRGDPAEGLLLGLSHVKEVLMRSGHGFLEEEVDVSLEIRSISMQPLVVSVCAVGSEVERVEFLGEVFPPGGSMESKEGREGKDGNLNVVLKETQNTGLVWAGKTCFRDIRIGPGETLVLPFLALLTQTGIYDLNKFLLLVSYVGVDRKQSRKMVPGQSLLEVFQDNM